MRVEALIDIIDADFYAGVPDSQLKALCDFLLDKYGTDPKHHIIAANEGNATALAAGYHLATGEVPVVYMQNSGEGNVINPLASLLNPEVYGIPCIFIIGWRGEPGVHDEPQHIYQGKVTCELLDVMDVEYRVLSPETTEEEVCGWKSEFKKPLAEGKSAAIVVKKGALEYEGGEIAEEQESKKDKPIEKEYKIFGDKLIDATDKAYSIREEVIRHIVRFTGDDPIVSTTGKISRELFEIREEVQINGGEKAGEIREDSKYTEKAEKYGLHAKDFLTVGSMGHCSSIALGIAIQKPDRRVWCIDGDGAALMHMGAMAVIADVGAPNLIHIVLNNGAHDTVGGQPTVLAGKSLTGVARELGYSQVYEAESLDEVDEILEKVLKDTCSTFIEIKCAKGARDDLGRPTTTAQENKISFMKALQK